MIAASLLALLASSKEDPLADERRTVQILEDRDTVQTLDDRYRCAACVTHATLGRAICGTLGSCRFDESDCGACPAYRSNQSDTSAAPATLSAAEAAPYQLRVAKSYGTKRYDMLRVSVITPSSAAAPFAADYAAPFQYKWRQHALHSSVVAASSTTKSGEHQLRLLNTTITLPAQGSGVTGVLIADPCVSRSQVGCSFERKFKTSQRTMALLNLFAGEQA